MTPPSCGARLLVGTHWLRCSALPDHPGTHTAYWGARLYDWPNPL